MTLCGESAVPKTGFRYINFKKKKHRKSLRLLNSQKKPYMNPKEALNKPYMKVYIVKYLWGVAHVLRCFLVGTGFFNKQ